MASHHVIDISGVGYQQVHRSEQNNCQKLCNKKNLIFAATLLIIGIGMGASAVPKIINDLANATINVNATVDLKTLKLSEQVAFQINTGKVIDDGVMAILGLFSTAMATGMLLNMACQTRD